VGRHPTTPRSVSAVNCSSSHWRQAATPHRRRHCHRFIVFSAAGQGPKAGEARAPLGGRSCRAPPGLRCQAPVVQRLDEGQSADEEDVIGRRSLCAGQTVICAGQAKFKCAGQARPNFNGLPDLVRALILLGSCAEAVNQWHVDPCATSRRRCPSVAHSTAPAHTDSSARQSRRHRGSSHRSLRMVTGRARTTSSTLVRHPSYDRARHHR
jgi:hypothetical protein